MQKVFISWSRETRPVAEAIGNWLSETSPELQGWVSSVDIVAGQKWRAEIDTALTGSVCAVACLGPSAVRSPWVLYETGAIGSKKPVIPITLLVPPKKLPPTLKDFQILNPFPEPSAEPDGALPRELAKSLAQITGSESAAPDADADHRLLGALRKFSAARIEAIREMLRATRRADTLVEILKVAKAQKGSSPRSLSENGQVSELMGKKYLAAIAIFWLHENGLLDVDDFDNVTAGKVSLSFNGNLLLSALVGRDG